MGVERWLFRERSPYQEIAIGHVPELGRALFLDAVVQLAELDEFVYHEHLVLPPLLFHPAPRSVLILGGGDGMALREALRDSRVEQAVLVEIDERVIGACREHFADVLQGSFDAPRSRLVIRDALDYLASTPERFDVVIADLLDVHQRASLDLYSEVLSLTRRVLSPGGILCQFGDLAMPYYWMTPLYVGMARAFRHVVLHRAWLESFTSVYGFVLASDGVDFRRETSKTLRSRARALESPPKALVPEQYPSAFELPPYLARHLEEALAREQAELEADWATVSWLFPGPKPRA